MPIFPNIQPNMPLQMPPFNPLPAVFSQEIVVAGPSQELQEIKQGQQKIESLMQTFGNEFVNLKKQQFQPRQPF